MVMIGESSSISTDKLLRLWQADNIVEADSPCLSTHTNGVYAVKAKKEKKNTAGDLLTVHDTHMWHIGNWDSDWQN